jgi:hypothetical protein
MLAVLLLCSAARAFAVEEGFLSYMPPSGSFACDLPASGWSALEERSVRGISVRLIGPAGARLRPAYQVHFVQKDTPGYIPIMDALKRERACEAPCTRESMPMQAWRISERAAKVFEIRERRRMPQEGLPSEPVMLHHFYAFLPAGDDYFVVKLTVDEEQYNDWRLEFHRFLKTFRIIGHR